MAFQMAFSAARWSSREEYRVVFLLS